MMISYLLLLLLLTWPTSSKAQTSWEMTYDVTYKVVSNTLGWVYETIGVADVCPFATDFSEVAKRAVHNKIRCQER